ncbi:S1C family serine protease [Deinococcus sp. Leaf326]|uniref:S1C family serine protease n=1 Tax=Deinococcus sp. Leaf326 TaxID=1736338 RepID=UPI0006F84469|nr:trypsin-like peptidase domain-containing protein [Deinococcus sp. Leaf326]KQR40983.1 serine protease [Deinococcus sp. Leaf326]
MNRNLSLLALSGALALGGFVGYSINERSAAQTAQTQTTQPTAAQSATPRGQMVQTLAQTAPATSATYDNGRARTQSEANTVDVVKARQNGLVYISVTEKASGGAQAHLRDQLERQFGFGLPDGLGDGTDGGSQGDRQATGTGSGFFVNPQGDIITNNHVVEGASDITIRLHGSKQTYKARVVARAPDYDLALIRAEGLPSGAVQPMPLGNSDQLDVGLKAVAMGAPFNLDFSVSEGIISSLERTVPVGTKGVSQKVIQTDAAINPGNSGGPLLDSAGQVIGVNTQILTGGAGQSAGVGFAIPVNTVKTLLPKLQAGKGGVLQTPSLGIQFTDLSGLTSEQRAQAGLPATGALVQEVLPNSPAAAAGLRGGTSDGTGLSLNGDAGTGRGTSRSGGGQGDVLNTNGDVVTAIDGQPVTEGGDLQRAILGKQLGDSVRLTVRRGGQTREVTVNLKAFAFPNAQTAQDDGQ